MAAALATLRALADPNESIHERIVEVGARLMHGLGEIAAASSIPVLVQGFPEFAFMGFTRDAAIEDHRGLGHLDLELAKLFMRLVVSRGVRPYTRPAWMVSAAHTPADIDQTIEVCRDALLEMMTVSRIHAPADSAR
jgi:glutamate-1-semialdehyde 2,1-aminomutase